MQTEVRFAVTGETLRQSGGKRKLRSRQKGRTGTGRNGEVVGLWDKEGIAFVNGRKDRHIYI